MRIVNVSRKKANDNSPRHMATAKISNLNNYLETNLQTALGNTVTK